MLLALAAAGATPARAQTFSPSADGYLTSWLVSGVERAPRQARSDFRGYWLGAGHGAPAVRDDWRPLDSRRARLTLHDRDADAVTHLALDLDVDAPVTTWLALGCDDDVLVWLDGERVPTGSFAGWLVPDQQWVRLALAPGRHELRLTAYNGRGAWELSARLLDEYGRPESRVRLLRARPGGDVPLDDATIASAFAVDLHGEVDDAGAVWGAFLVEYGGGLPDRAVVVCAEVRDDPEAPEDPGTPDTPDASRCLPLAAWAAAPRRVSSPLGTGDELTLTLTLHSAEGATTRTFARELHRHPEAAAALARARALARDDAAWSALPEASRHSFTWTTERLAGLIAEDYRHIRYTRELAARLEAMSDAVAAGVDPYQDARGPLYRAYRSPIDGSLQHYALFVPDRYEPGEPLPLVVSLHGLGSTAMMNLRQVLGYDRDPDVAVEDAIREFPDVGNPRALFVAPEGFGDSLFRFMGESDVLAVIDEVSAAYAVDPHRVYLTGLSMGGIGTFDIGTHHADRFAALLALAGTADMRRYSEVREHPSYPWELGLVDEYGAARYAPNAINLAVHAIHGTEDGTHYSHSRDFLEALAEHGVPTSLETPRLPHNVWAWGYAEDGVLARLGAYRAPGFPEAVNVVAATYRYAHQYWVTIERLERVHTFATVQARIRHRATGTRLELTTEHVHGVRLDLDQAPGDLRAEPLTVEIDGAVVCEGACWERLHLAWVPTSPGSGVSRWVRADGPPDLGGHKRPGLEGPIQDIYFDAVALVYGTLDPRQSEALRRIAELERYFYSNQDARFPVVADVDVDDAFAASHHLVLVGDAASNALLARLDEWLPIRARADGVEVGGVLVEGTDMGAVFVYPNPEHPDRYVVVRTGNSVAGIDATRYAPRFSPDFLVLDQGVRAGAPWYRTMRGRPVRAGGFFRDDWSLPPADDWLAPRAD